MKNFYADGDSIVVLAPYAVTPGLGMLIGSLFCVATKTAAMGATTDAVTEGQFDLTAVSAETATPGAVAFWDDTNRRVSVSTGTPIGTLPYGKSAGVAVARVRLQSVAGAVSGGGSGGGGNSVGLVATAYDGSNRVIGYTLNGVDYTVSGWGGATVTISGSDGSTRTIGFDGSGRIAGVA